MKQNKTNESGRSMVEMLGVLAIIGVLSVGGIQGYKYAMTKHQANKLMNAFVTDYLSVNTAYRMAGAPTTNYYYTDADLAAEFPNTYPLTSLYSKMIAVDTPLDGPFVCITPNKEIYEEFCRLSPALDGLITKFYASYASGNASDAGSDLTIYCTDCNLERFDLVYGKWHTDRCNALLKKCQEDERMCEFCVRDSNAS